MTQDDYDTMYREWRAEENQRLNGHFPWTFASRVAFSRWRRAALHTATGVGALRRIGPRWMRRLMVHWHDRLLDALYPDECFIQFPAATEGVRA
jgi:hypothetical protein